MQRRKERGCLTAVAGANKDSDWGFSAAEPGGAFHGGMRHWYFWWTERDLRNFEKIWSVEGDQVVDWLIEMYEAAWPWMTARALRARVPVLVRSVSQLGMEISAEPNRDLPSYASNSTAMTDSILLWGAFQIARQRRGWPESHSTVCPVCRCQFWTGELSPWTYPQFGPARYCMRCCQAARDGASGQPGRGAAARALCRLAEVIEGVPPQRFAFQAIPVDIDPARRDEIVQALQATPPVETLKALFEVRDWLGVLQPVGLIDGGWRPSMGTWCRAEDGHRCRSLLEKSIDDWLHRHGIAHQPEPRWPAHPTLNPSGRKRADWLLADGTFVECAGIITDREYEHKIEEKRRLADQLGIRLIIVNPSDIARLERLFPTSTH